MSENEVHVRPMVQGYRTPCILLIQITIIASLSLVTTYIVLPKIEPAHHGFYCNDPDLSLKYRGNTVDIQAVHLTGYLLLLVIIFLIECRPLHFFNQPKACLTELQPLNERLTSAAYVFFASQLGLAMNLLLYQVVKYSCGRLRPHFFDVCHPNVLQCTPGSYIENYVCTGTNEKLLRDARMSFYSGHASTVFYYAAFLIVYMQMRLRRRLLHCLPFLYVYDILLIAAASFVSLTRMTDNKHHASDVAVGCVVGIILGVSVVLVYLREVLSRIAAKPYVLDNEATHSLEVRRFQSVHSNDHIA